MAIRASELQPEKIQGGIYYIDGGDSYWVKFAEEAFKAILPKESLSLFVFDRISGLGEPLTALDTVGFFGGENVVIVKDSDYRGTERDKALLEKASAGDNKLLFINVKFLSDKDKKRFTAIDCKKSDKSECVKFAAKFFENGIDRDALYRLTELTDCDMAKIRNEAEKLTDYCGTEKVTLKDVLELVADDADAQMFAFVGAVTEGRKEQAQKMMNRLLKYGNSPSALLAALIGQYRRMLHGRLSKKSDADLAALMKVKEFAVTKARSARKTGTKTLKGTLDMLVEYERKFKSGEMSDRTAFAAAVGRLLSEEIL